MKVEEALALISKIIVFLVEEFEKMMVFIDGAKYYIAAVSICLSVRYLLGPLMGRSIHSGSDSAANRRR